jgi:hypothetical protein
MYESSATTGTVEPRISTVPVAVTLLTSQTPSNLSPRVGSLAQEAKINRVKEIIDIFFMM